MLSTALTSRFEESLQFEKSIEDQLRIGFLYKLIPKSSFQPQGVLN